MQDWRTPQWLFNRLNNDFGPFDIDAACDEDNMLCDYGWTIEADALKQDWGKGQRIFCNPPFRNIYPWVHKGFTGAYTSSGRSVFILPSSVNSKWFHLALRNGRVLFPTKRIKFEHPSVAKSRPDRDTIIVLFGYGRGTDWYEIG